MAQYNFSFKIRQAAQVAAAVASEVGNVTRFGGEHSGDGTFIPSLLSIAAPETKNEVVFRYEGGTVVRVHLFDLDTLTEYWRTPHVESWVVYGADVRYFSLDPKSYFRVGNEKVEEKWDAAQLTDLREHRPFRTGLASVDDICGYVGVFVDYVSRDGFIEVDPAHNQSGHCRIVDGVSYRVLVDGDLEIARAAARKRLAELLAAE